LKSARHYCLHNLCWMVWRKSAIAAPHIAIVGGLDDGHPCRCFQVTRQTILLMLGERLMAKSKTDRCTGDCCKRFSIRYSPSEIREHYAKWLKALKEGAPLSRDIGFEDIWTIALMVRYLGTDDIGVDGNKLNAKAHWYTCIHFNKETNDCDIYEQRPAMCRNYPYGSPCLYPGCTYKEARAGNPCATVANIKSLKGKTRQ
jgi:Fe-S-cluster containining protein